MEQQLWHILLTLKEHISSYKEEVRFCHILQNGKIEINEWSSDIASEGFQLLISLDNASPTFSSKAITHLRLKNILEVELEEQGR